MIQNKLHELMLLLICVLFIQVGISFYLSFQMLLFIYIFCLIFKLRNKKNIEVLMLLVVLFLLLSMSSYFSYYSWSTGDSLRAAREALCAFVLMLGTSSIFNKRFIFVNEGRTTIVRTFFLAILILLFVQVVFSKFGLFFNLSTDFFVINRPQFEASELYSLYGYQIRQSLTYGEPSYLSLIALGGALYSIPKIDIKLTIICFSIVLLTESTLGVLGIISMQALWFIEIKFGKNVALLSVFISILILVVSLVIFKDDILDFKGMSAYIRIYAPSYILGDVFSNHPFGISWNSMFDHFQNSLYGSIIGIGAFEQNFVGLDNGFLNLLYIYGYCGLIMYCIVFFFIYNNTTTILCPFIYMLFSIQNGTIFSYDKVGLILFFYYIFRFQGLKKFELV